jgi:light-regulated signal transduction histidine kinase (bacteriophytochrome)
MSGISRPADVFARPARRWPAARNAPLLPAAGWPSVSARAALLFLPLALAVPLLAGSSDAMVVPSMVLVLAAMAVLSVALGSLWHRRASTDRTIRELNDRLDVSERRLRVVSSELEAFAYSVSHDLRTPLRSIDGFSQALVEDYAADLDDIGRDHLNRVRHAAQRMGELIDDLLALSRVTRAALNRRAIDISAIADAVADGFRSLDPQRAAEWRIAPGLSVEADPALVRVALDNLIGNAWKFTARANRPIIAFGVDQTTRGPAFYVADNGAGFDMAYADKLFGAFQRLHSTDDYPGTGIGLATVQRVIDKHGGRIWVDATPGQGATFYFTLGTDG